MRRQSVQNQIIGIVVGGQLQSLQPAQSIQHFGGYHQRFNGTARDGLSPGGHTPNFQHNCIAANLDRGSSPCPCLQQNDQYKIRQEKEQKRLVDQDQGQAGPADLERLDELPQNPPRRSTKRHSSVSGAVAIADLLAISAATK
ncbi:Uncharacterised protein [Mycobacteroides abscessus subsp. abscessus]|nr:Uncharacterised protein [Mycobacteroides abscessus subsp. abscessus]